MSCRTEADLDQLIIHFRPLASSSSSAYANYELACASKAVAAGCVKDVTLQGLVNQSQYNGKHGRLLGASKDRADRWAVQIYTDSGSEDKVLLLDHKNIAINYCSQSAADQKPVVFKACFVCSGRASSKCKICEEKFGKSIYYCGRECQSKDWQKHKQHHEELQTLVDNIANDVATESKIFGRNHDIDLGASDNPLRQTPLIVAACCGKSKTVEKLLKSGQQDLLAVDAVGNCALSYAIISNDIKCAELLVRDAPASAFAPGGRYSSEVFKAVQFDRGAIAELLLRRAPPGFLSAQFLPVGAPAATVLMEAACCLNRGAVVALLAELAGDAVLRAPLSGGRPPLHAASSSGALDVVRLLLRAGGPDLPFATHDPSPARAAALAGYTALHAACGKGHLEVVRALVAAGGQRLLMVRGGAGGLSCLHVACDSDRPVAVDIVRALVAAGGAPLLALPCANGETALERAAAAAAARGCAAEGGAVLAELRRLAEGAGAPGGGEIGAGAPGGGESGGGGGGEGGVEP